MIRTATSSRITWCPDDKRKNVAELKTALKGATDLMLATDPDREGESISWHLLQVLKPKIPVKRIVFHEITKKAVEQAIKEAHDVDDNLVRAQESRRILDRLYGYTLSPVLWKKVQTGLSAGRVQSVAVRLIVDREEQRLAFKTAKYADLEALFSADGRNFPGALSRVGETRIASGKDFDANGVLTGKNVRLLSDADAQTLGETLTSNLPWTVTSVEAKPGVERPAAPFTTSTLTQEASRKLGFSTQRTMQAAQRLFQDGHISYHRTDSTTLSDEALSESAQAIRELFGNDYYSGPRRYQTKVKNAQEAHEAIRPTNFTSAASTLGGVLSGDDLRLYELIWKRTMASQMVDARVLRTNVEISAPAGNNQTAIFTASGKAIEFAGFRRAYVEGSDDPTAELEEQETVLPTLTVGERIARDGTRVRLVVARRQEPRDQPAGALHGSVADQGARAHRRRSALDVRGNDRHHRATRLRVPSGQGAGAELHGVRGHAPAARPFRRPDRHRVHGRDGRGSRPDLARRARVARLHQAVLSRRQASSRPGRSGQAGAGERGLPAHRGRHRSQSQARTSASASDATVRSSSSAKAVPARRQACRRRSPPRT